MTYSIPNLGLCWMDPNLYLYSNSFGKLMLIVLYNICKVKLQDWKPKLGIHIDHIPAPLV